MLAASTPVSALARPSPSSPNLARPVIHVDENTVSTLQNPTSAIREILPNKTLPDPPLVTHVVIDGEDIEIHALNPDLVAKILPFLKDYICQSDDAVLFPEMCHDALLVAVPSDGYSNSTEHKHHARHASSDKTTTSTGIHNGHGPPINHVVTVTRKSTMTTQCPSTTTTTTTIIPVKQSTITDIMADRSIDARMVLPSPSNQHQPMGGNATLTTSPHGWSGPSWTSTPDASVTPTETTTIGPLYIPRSKVTDTTTTHHGGHNSNRATSHDYKAYSNSPPGGCLDLPSTFSTCTVTVWPNTTTLTASNKPSAIAKYSSGNRPIVSANGTLSQYPDMDERQEVVSGWERLKWAMLRYLSVPEEGLSAGLKFWRDQMIEKVNQMDAVMATFKKGMGWYEDRETRSS
ncbi:hypothetical protein VMCG_06971 [Cytospora schulzeri]|uniref:Uncharacterized protein n=1 Tax=Cytospora schulzeri TaxID=448051 RepID=A0A423W3Y8_9PEZI|nr:hypothetical protein VMCG_06971 [Valsa malicola]